MTLDFSFMLVYIFIFISGLVCLFLGCLFRKGEPRKRFDKRWRRFGLHFWRTRADNRYQWADSLDEAARLANTPASDVPDLELLNLYLKEPIELTEEEKKNSKVSEEALQAEKELIMKRKAMRDAPHTSHYTRRDAKKQHVEIQVEAEVESYRRRHLELNLKPEPKVKFQQKFTTRAQQRRREDIELRGDNIQVVCDNDIADNIV